MSIYRPRKVLPETDVTASIAPEHADVHIPPAAMEQTSGWAPLRKSNPANIVLPVGRKWLDALPSHLRPNKLMEQYPRIVNLIALDWDNLPAMRKVFDDLLIDQRGSRRGFPDEVRHELRALRDYYYLTVVR